MQVENQQFLQIIARKQTQNLAAEVVQSVAPEAAASTQVTSVVEELLAKNTEATIYSIADEAAKNLIDSKVNYLPDENSGTDLYTTKTTIKSFTNYLPDTNSESANVNNIAETIKSDLVITTKYAVTYNDLSDAEIYNIKKIIYDLHFKDTDPEEPTDPTDPTDPEDPDVDPDDPYIPEEDDDPKPSFIDEFDDVETMFDWMHEQDPTISKTKGLTRDQLFQFTQNDDWEDANYDFFGSLNRIWDVLNKDGDDYLTVDEIKELVGEEIGSSFSSYKAKVEAYSDEIQAEYEALDAQGKLEFAIELTREYLEAAGLTDQLTVLDELTKATEEYPKNASVGQIGFASLEGNLLGGYTSFSAQCQYNGMDYSLYLSDTDSDNGDLGITLNEDVFLNGTWYELVDTLVHELTHATASLYSNIIFTGYSGELISFEVGTIEQSTIDKMYEAGALTEDEYSYYSANINTLINEAKMNGEYSTFVFSNEKLNRFYYLFYTMWGEYRAYQTDADYIDSIAGDVYTSDNTIDIATDVNGSGEKDAISNHITSVPNYEGEAVPDWKWWTYA